jgi:hypothetical protein
MIFKELIEIPNTIERIKAAINDLINTLPDNPKIKRIEGKPNCFTIKFSDLNKMNLSPFHYDFKSQAELIIKIINESRAEFIMSNIKQIIDTGSIYYKGQRYKFNPMFCNNLKILVETYGGD